VTNDINRWLWQDYDKGIDHASALHESISQIFIIIKETQKEACKFSGKSL